MVCFSFSVGNYFLSISSSTLSIAIAETIRPFDFFFLSYFLIPDWWRPVDLLRSVGAAWLGWFVDLVFYKGIDYDYYYMGTAIVDLLLLLFVNWLLNDLFKLEICDLARSFKDWRFSVCNCWPSFCDLLSEAA